MHLTGESDGRDLEGVFAVGRARPFLVTARPRRGGRPRSLDVHVSKQVAPRGYGAQLKRQLHRHGIEERVRVHRHGEARLWRSGSLQELTAPFGSDEAILDPTGAMGRARDLVGFATALRDRLGERLKGVYWEPYRRALFVVFARKGGPAPDPRALEAEVRSLLLDKAGPSVTDYVTAVRLGFAVPRGTLVPIDTRSATLGRRETRATSTWWRTPVLALALGAAIPGTAAAQQYFQATPGQQAPAVSAPNWTYGAEGGSVDGDGTGLVTGSYVAPLTYDTGYRVDGAAGGRGDGFAGGLGAHYFRRDPNFGLFGVFGTWGTIDPGGPAGRENRWRFAGEAEFYYPNMTVVGVAGVHLSDGGDDGFFGRLQLEWYATDNTMLSAGIHQSPDTDTLGIFKAEFQPGYYAMPGLALFLEGATGGDYSRVMAGMKVYLGSPKSLKDRHRYDTFAAENDSEVADVLKDREKSQNPTPQRAAATVRST